jgi:hypothetical protein
MTKPGRIHTRRVACALLFAVLSCLPAAVCRAQDTSDRSPIGRLRCDHQRRLNETVRGFSVLSYEQPMTSDVQAGANQKLTVKGGVSHHAQDWLRLEGGIGTYYSWRDATTDLFEVRLWQAVTMDWPEVHAVSRWVLQHRFMMEERVQYSGEQHATLRGRYRASLSLPLNRHEVEPGTFYIPLSAEFFWDAARNDAEPFSNRFRLVAGLGCQISKAWAIDLRYTWQESRDTVGKSIAIDDSVVELRIRSTHGIFDYLKGR